MNDNILFITFQNAYYELDYDFHRAMILLTWDRGYFCAFSNMGQ